VPPVPPPSGLTEVERGAQTVLRDLVERAGGRMGLRGTGVRAVVHESVVVLLQEWAYRHAVEDGRTLRFPGQPGMWQALDRLYPLQDPNRWDGIRKANLAELERRGWHRLGSVRGSAYELPSDRRPSTPDAARAPVPPALPAAPESRGMPARPVPPMPQPAPAHVPTPTPTPAPVTRPWIDQLLCSSVLHEQRAKAARAPVPDDLLVLVLTCLEDASWVITRPALLAATGMSSDARLTGLIQSMRRILNVDGSHVLDADQGTLRLSPSLLRTQFGL
jgi:hypothetical protein